MKPTKIYKQKQGDSRCVAFAAAHATDTTPEEFESFCKGYKPYPKQEAPYEDIHFLAYVMSLGYMPGLTLRPQHRLENLPIDDLYFNASKFPISRCPAYVVVQSKYRADWDHAIYWDGEQFWDSAPLTNHGLHPSEYNIKLWVPITKNV